MEFNFPAVEGTGIPKLIPHASAEVQDIICKLLIYNPDNRISASLALKHPWFKEIRDQE
jgi:renal tumor antigen